MHWEPAIAPADGEEVPAGLPPVAEPRSGSASNLAKEIPILVIVAFLAAFLVRTLVFQAFYIPSASMGCSTCPVHTLEINDKVIVSKISYRIHAPRRGDVVVFECPPLATCTKRKSSPNALVGAFRFIGSRVGLVPPSTEDYIKRIVALPGELVEGRGGFVYVNGRILDEPYLPPAVITSDFGPVIVPPDNLWVMGDNRANSGDSRVFGTIDRDSVVGRTVMRILPIRRTAFL